MSHARPPRRTFARLGLERLEGREVPAVYAVGVLSPAVGDVGESAASFSGGIHLKPNLPTLDGKAIVSAASPTAAIQAALMNAITATLGTQSANYQPGPNTVGTSPAAHRPFLVTTTTTAGQYTLRLEDLAVMSGQTPDWDYNDRTWSVVATPVVDPEIPAPPNPPSGGTSPVPPGPVVVAPDPTAPPVPPVPATPSQPGPYPIPPTSPPPATGTIHGWVWNDGASGDGIQQPAEEKLNGVGVWLYSVGSGSYVAQTWTNDVGEYQFTGLALGQYQVAFRAATATAYTLYRQGTDPQVDSDVATATAGGYGWTDVVSLTAGSPVQWYTSAGTLPSASVVAGRVWTDLNADGIQDAGEPGVGGQTVLLLKNGVALGSPAVTDDDGYYSFQVVRDPAAEYKVQFEKPSSYSFSPWFQGGDRTIDSDADPDTGRSPEVFTSSLSLAAVGGGLVPANESIAWSVRAPEQAEGSRPNMTNQRTFTVTRKDTTQAAAVDYTTVDGTATAGADYTATSGTLNFNAGQASKTVTVTITEDTTQENDEEFYLVLKVPNFQAMPDGSTAEGRRTPFGRGIIRNDDFPNNFVDTWAGWVVDPHKTVDIGGNYENGTWMRGWDGDTPTYITPGGTPWVHSMIDEGPYLKTNAQYRGFRFTVEWRVIDSPKAARPMWATGEWRGDLTAEHYGNSGVYIYDRYEVQVISSGVPFGQAVPDQLPSLKTQLAPGWAYKVPPPTPQDTPVNFSRAVGTWNKMEIEFLPPVLSADGKTVEQAAKMLVWFRVPGPGGQTTNYAAFGGATGWELVDGATKLKATGNKQNSKDVLPADIGHLFLQGHWGSRVEYKNPVIETITALPTLVT